MYLSITQVCLTRLNKTAIKIHKCIYNLYFSTTTKLSNTQLHEVKRGRGEKEGGCFLDARSKMERSNPI